MEELLRYEMPTEVNRRLPEGSLRVLGPMVDLLDAKVYNSYANIDILTKICPKPLEIQHLESKSMVSPMGFEQKVAEKVQQLSAIIFSRNAYFFFLLFLQNIEPGPRVGGGWRRMSTAPP